jgi:hypothetical protein
VGRHCGRFHPGQSPSRLDRHRPRALPGAGASGGRAQRMRRATRNMKPGGGTGSACRALCSLRTGRSLRQTRHEPGSLSCGYAALRAIRGSTAPDGAPSGPGGVFSIGLLPDWFTPRQELAPPLPSLPSGLRAGPPVKRPHRGSRVRPAGADDTVAAVGAPRPSGSLPASRTHPARRSLQPLGVPIRAWASPAHNPLRGIREGDEAPSRVPR